MNRYIVATDSALKVQIFKVVSESTQKKLTERLEREDKSVLVWSEHEIPLVQMDSKGEIFLTDVKLEKKPLITR